MSAEPIHRGAAVERIAEGMVVRDEAGAELGTVERVKFGDPQAATVLGNDPLGRGMAHAAESIMAADRAEPEVPEPLRSNLLRLGYIKIDGPGLAGEDRYVAMDRVVAVSGGMVTIRRGAPGAREGMEESARETQGSTPSSPTAVEQTASATRPAPAGWQQETLEPPFRPAPWWRPSPLVALALGALAAIPLFAAWAWYRRRRALQRRPLARARRAGQMLRTRVAAITQR